MAVKEQTPEYMEQAEHMQDRKNCLCSFRKYYCSIAWNKEFPDLKTARNVIFRSFEIKCFKFIKKLWRCYLI